MLYLYVWIPASTVVRPLIDSIDNTQRMVPFGKDRRTSEATQGEDRLNA